MTRPKISIGDVPIGVGKERLIYLILIDLIKRLTLFGLELHLVTEDVMMKQRNYAVRLLTMLDGTVEPDTHNSGILDLPQSQMGRKLEYITIGDLNLPLAYSAILQLGIGFVGDDSEQLLKDRQGDLHYLNQLLTK